MARGAPQRREYALTHALQYNGKMHVKLSQEMIAKITAAHLVEQPRISGFLVMKAPPARVHGDPAAPPNKQLTD